MDITHTEMGWFRLIENIRPEFVTTYEANLDLGFKDRIKFTGSIYQQDTKDLITDRNNFYSIRYQY